MFGFVPLAVVQSLNHAPAISLQFSRADEMVLTLDGKPILDAHVQGLHGKLLRDSVKLIGDVEPATPMFLGYPHGPKTADWAPDGAVKRSWRLVFDDPNLTLTGVVSAGKDSRPCTTSPDAPLAATYGAAVSTFDTAVYDRADDWLLDTHGAVQRTARGFAFRTAGSELSLKTNYYRDHRGYFLWDRSRVLWSKPVAGWCSWAAYGQDVTQKEVESAAEFFSKNLRGYGYGVIQIDDGYQRVLQNHRQPPADLPSRFPTIGPSQTRGSRTAWGAWPKRLAPLA